MTDFTKIKTKYVKNKIKGLKDTAKNREYIEALMLIEDFMQKIPHGMHSGYMIKGLNEKYPKEWHAIGTELDSKHKTTAQMEIEDREIQKRIDAELKKQKMLEEKLSKDSWKRMAGK